ncbi:M20 family metallopeptidase [Halobacillus litoralis]|uniref:M20 metallopeptidase family protein n=1 Tax=Halobacillus litoralis TaxID=45668 RepID=UPI001CD42EF7|nr:M20 family metallopeptidase [Halobacillus litoralis]MCA0971441.1 M20 family metallopeptidase [Halobacillus litoralis]
MDVRKYIDQIKPEMIEIRRYLHQHPELSGEEHNTSQFIQQKLTEYGIEYQTGFATTGVLGIIKGNHSGKTVALRADIDALPIQEVNDLSFRSQSEGKMHACGHDAHTAMLLAVGFVLNQIKNELHGTVLLVFQPSEENAPEGGAKQMLEDGVFSQYKPDVIFGQHVWPSLPDGQIGVRDKEMMGASDRFKVTIKGRGGHASMPQDTVDAVVIANQMIGSLQTIVSRNINPLESAVLTIGKIEGGYRYNVIADQVTFEGTVRTYLPQVKEKVKERFYTLLRQSAAAFNAEVEIHYADGYPATINTPEWAEQVRQTSQKLFGESSTPEVQPVLAGEDFSRFLNEYPGAFFWLGSRIEEGDQKALHDPQFQLNEKSLPRGATLMAQTAIDALRSLKKEV